MLVIKADVVTTASEVRKPCFKVNVFTTGANDVITIAVFGGSMCVVGGGNSVITSVGNQPVNTGANCVGGA